MARRFLDGNQVEKITAFLFHAGESEDPKKLRPNVDKSFVGSMVRGMGFTFDDQDTKGVATQISEMNRMINDNPTNREIIFPYIGGQEVNSSPTHAHHRFAINFRDYPLTRSARGKEWAEADHEQRRQWLKGGVVPEDYPKPVASDWPELLEVVKQKVLPERSSLGKTPIDQKDARLWWQYSARRPKLYATIADLDRVLVISRVGQHCSFAFLPTETVFSDSLIVFSTHSDAAFCTLQSRPHEVWSRFFGSSMKDDLRYTPSDCFETFPLPIDWESHSRLEAIGREYYHFRLALMMENDEGLTRTYNRFHNPSENNPSVLKLRQLHAGMDREVLDAYGWADVSTDCDFIPEYSVDDEEQTKGVRKVRYSWPESVREEVLGRLLELNAERAARQRRLGKPTRTPRLPRPLSRSQSEVSQPALVE